MSNTFEPGARNERWARWRELLARGRARRALVVTQVVCALLVGLAIYARGDQFAWAALATIPFWLCACLVDVATLGIFARRDDQLDERQRAERDRAYRATYETTLVALIVVVAATWIVGPSLRVTFGIGAGAFLLCVLAPRLVYAWRVGDAEAA